MKIYDFHAKIMKHDSMNAAFIEFPYDVEKEFGTKGRVKVHATFDGCEYRGSLVKMGHHCHIIGITQKVRKIISKEPGDTVHVILRKDDEAREIHIPEDFKKELEENKEAEEFFHTLSYTNRKEYINWITSAKKAETRKKRINESINMLLSKKVRR